MARIRFGVALALILAGCGVGREPLASPSAGQMSAEAFKNFDRAAYISKSADVIAEAVHDGNQATVTAFESWARGGDPDPAATRAIAGRTLTLLKSGKYATPKGPSRTGLEAIAGGMVKPRATVRAKAISFPRDEAAHMEAITEWWYMNGHLSDGHDEKFGYEFSLFRVGPVLLFAHVALTNETDKTFHYVRDWYEPAHTSSAKDRLDTRYGTEILQAVSDGKYRLSGQAGVDGFDLDLTSRKSALLINGDGKIDMPEGRDSWYYSLTRLDTVGTVHVGDRSVRVRGLSWMDHQWGPFYVTGFRERWDWFSLQLDDGTDYNLFAFRKGDGTPLSRYVNSLDSDGRFAKAGDFGLARTKWWQSPKTLYNYTTGWELDLPSTGERITLEATVADQEVARLLPWLGDPLPEYWEGSMNVVKILRDGTKVSGHAYTETFGFSKPGR